MSRREPHPADIHIGNCIRMQRGAIGMSQSALGREIGLTFQQIQKYEKGHNRVSGSRLYLVAKALDVPVSTFFDGYEEENGAPKPNKSSDLIDQLGKSRTGLRLLTAYENIEDLSVKSALLKLVEGTANRRDN